MKVKSSTIGLPLLLAIVMAVPAIGGPVMTFDDIDTWVGLGNQEAALVLDWNDGKEPGIWGYRFDGPKTGQDMLQEIIQCKRNCLAESGQMVHSAVHYMESGTTGTVMDLGSAITWATKHRSLPHRHTRKPGYLTNSKPTCRPVPMIRMTHTEKVGSPDSGLFGTARARPRTAVGPRR